uniref:Uncharacterized protein n=1 Tax=Physcomitrium patens TaxID=3218 RepID=A0A2K1IY88_PHYPA|nr:hypothetical protein PHYPA_024053 [Physcomitrium patens]
MRILSEECCGFGTPSLSNGDLSSNSACHLVRCDLDLHKLAMDSCENLTLSSLFESAELEVEYSSQAELVGLWQWCW